MYLPYRLLARELQRNGSWRAFLQYQKSLNKLQRNTFRIDFLTKCKHSDIIPRFLQFRIPSNGCFDDRSVRDFQLKLLKNEILKAKTDLRSNNKLLAEQRNTIQAAVKSVLLPSILVYTRANASRIRREQILTHNNKLSELAEAQQFPLFSVKNTVLECELDQPLPQYVTSTLALGLSGPRHFQPQRCAGWTWRIA